MNPDTRLRNCRVGNQRGGDSPDLLLQADHVTRSFETLPKTLYHPMEVDRWEINLGSEERLA